MKQTTNNITKLISKFIIAFALAISVPTIASATCHTTTASSNHCSVDCSVYNNKSDYYKDLADKYLAKYNSSHCHSYYASYLCFAKKYEYYKNKFSYCTTSTNSATKVDCDKYKKLAEPFKTKAECFKKIADKYLATYNKCHWYCFKIYSDWYMKSYNYYMNIYNEKMKKYTECKDDIIVKLGSFTGQVFYDQNGNGIKDGNESGKADINLTVIDSEGNRTIITTNDKGEYTLDNVAVGDVIVTINPSTLPDGAELTTNNSVNATIIANENTKITENIGYKTPLVLGTVSGIVFVDTDGNGTKDGNETGAKDINVSITDQAGNTVIVVTDENGSYSKDGFTPGSTVTVEIIVDSIEVPEEDRNFKYDANVTTESSYDVQVVGNTDTKADDIGYVITKKEV